jgi:hypothetical protein
VQRWKRDWANDFGPANGIHMFFGLVDTRLFITFLLF